MESTGQAAPIDQVYEPPLVADLGSFAELTRGTTTALTMDNGMNSQA